MATCIIIITLYIFFTMYHFQNNHSGELGGNGLTAHKPVEMAHDQGFEPVMRIRRVRMELLVLEMKMRMTTVWTTHLVCSLYITFVFCAWKNNQKNYIVL